jgi:predicted phage terminase large subunit-like protein
MTVIKVPAFDPDATLRAIEKRACEQSLAEFIRRAWDVVEPGEKYLHNWHIDMICAHLEAVTFEEEIDGRPYNRLLINVPPGLMKSLILNVFWPSWEWGPCAMPHQRYLCAAHAQNLAIRDSMKMRRLVTSDWYRGYWGDRVKLTGDQNAKTKFETTATGFREAIAAGSITGARGTRVLIDDPHSVEGANSDAQRETTLEWFTEAVQTRLNNPVKSAIIVIMQRLHEDDVSGVILERKGFRGTYDHICLPMRYEKWRDGITTKLGYADPRTEEGELLFEDRFPEAVVDDLEAALGPYATAGQHQQTPAPRGGGIIKDAWWQPWTEKAYPALEYVVASLDTAYTEKTENDFSAMTVWGVWSQRSQEWGASHDMVAEDVTRTVDRYGRPMDRSGIAPPTKDLNVSKVIMTYAWQERLELHDLVLKVAKTCKTLKVDRLLIENKASGHSVAQELRRLFGNEQFSVQMYDPKSEDKMARLYSVQALFSQGLIYAPDKEWAETVIRQVATFPRAKHDDLVDTVSSSLRHLRDTGMLALASERAADRDEAMRYTSHNVLPLYGV